MIVKEIKLHHADKNCVDNIPCITFDHFDEHYGKQKAWEYLFSVTNGINDIVWLMYFKDEVFVTSSIHNLHTYFEMINAFESDDEIVSVYLQEYKSYEEAYSVALMMQEEKELCYGTGR